MEQERKNFNMQTKRQEIDNSVIILQSILVEKRGQDVRDMLLVKNKVLEIS